MQLFLSIWYPIWAPSSIPVIYSSTKTSNGFCETKQRITHKMILMWKYMKSPSLFISRSTNCIAFFARLKIIRQIDILKWKFNALICTNNVEPQSRRRKFAKKKICLWILARFHVIEIKLWAWDMWWVCSIFF